MNDRVSIEEDNLAWQAMLDGRYAEARQKWDSFVAREHNPLRFNMNRGVTLLLVGDLDEALAAFRELRDRPTPSRFPVPFIGAALWLRGEPSAACEDWQYEIGRRRAGEITHCDEAGGVEVPALLWWASAHPGLERWRKLAVSELKRRWKTKQCQRSDWPGPLAPP